MRRRFDAQTRFARIHALNLIGSPVLATVRLIGGTVAGRRKGGGSRASGGTPSDPVANPPVQLSLPLGDRPVQNRSGRKRRSFDAGSGVASTVSGVSGAPLLHVLDGGGAGAGHARGQLTAVGGRAVALRLPDRAELDRVLLQSLADLLAGRLTPTAAAAIREAAVAMLRAHDRADEDPDRFPELVRAARALRELVGSP